VFFFPSTLGIFDFTCVFGIMGALTFLDGISSHFTCCTHWLLVQELTGDCKGLFCGSVVFGCCHTVPVNACSCFCNTHGENHVLGSTSTTFALTGFQLGGGNSFNSSNDWMIFGVRDVLPPDLR